MPGSEAWQFLGNALGGNATPLAFEEIYLALQTGTIDGLENPLSDVISAKFYEVSKQIVLTDHQVSNTFFTIAKPFWDGLTDEEKAAIEAGRGRGQGLQRRRRARGGGRGGGLPRIEGPDRHHARRRRLPRPGAGRSSSRATSPRPGPRGCSTASTAPAPERWCRGCGRIWRHLAEGVAALAFAILFFAFIVQVVSRYLLNAPVAWTLELCAIAYVWVVFWSAGVLVPERRHIAFDILYQLVPPRGRRWLAIFLTACLGARLPRGAARRARLHPLPRPPAAPCCCTCGSTSSTPASRSSCRGDPGRRASGSGASRVARWRDEI